MSCKGLSELSEMPADELETYLNKQTKKKLVDMLLDEFLAEDQGSGFDEDETEDENEVRFKEPSEDSDDSGSEYED